MIRIELTNSFNGEDAILVGAVANLKTALEDEQFHLVGTHWEKLILAVNKGWAFLVSSPTKNGTRVVVGVTGSTRTAEWNHGDAGSRRI